jgi:hypothetical protein
LRFSASRGAVNAETVLPAEAAQSFCRAMRPIRPKPSFTIVPITPERLSEKRSIKDFFYETVLREGVRLAEKN